MDYAAALRYTLSLTDFERAPASLYAAANFDLRRMEGLLERVGAPHLGTTSVHVAGTKGKGSTAAMIATCLSDAGHRTGLYTSPHLHTFRERIRTDGEPISEAEFAALATRLKPEVAAVGRDLRYGEITTFELLTAMAFMHFRAKGVTVQVLEVGLGGRLDATNVVAAQVAVITPISLDHVDVLGHSLAQIAAEKAGIIKPGSTVICAPQPEEAAQVIEGACLQRGARLVPLGRAVTWEGHGGDTRGQHLTVSGLRGSYHLSISLLGRHQVENAATAVAALEALADMGIAIPGASIARGMAAALWPGRLEVLGERPLVVVDGAHNAEAARRLKEALHEYLDFERLILIIGTSQDKDVAGIVAELAPACQVAIATRSRHPRALAPDAIAGELVKQGVRAEVAPTVADAMRRALELAAPGDVVCASGSLFVAAEAREHWLGIAPELYS
ncbi:MAG: folylpolyglutamate synthase/dihydrofolate synthase family protein [Chloroflexota bacterium]|nr:folylpolyglutamate synthase/dihydrofolate synthase family protein [Chloroflexota bacterium]